VFSHYGHYEAAALAGYCEHANTYHVLPTYGYVELLDNNNNPITELGAVGEIVATSFIMDATPFIRYRTGDYATYGGIGCEFCNRPYLILDTIEGRAQDYLIEWGGGRIPVTCINMHSDVFDSITQWQIRQRTPGEIDFTYIPLGSDNLNARAAMHNALTRKLPKFTINMVPVAQIGRTTRGKHRYYINEGLEY